MSLIDMLKPKNILSHYDLLQVTNKTESTAMYGKQASSWKLASQVYEQIAQLVRLQSHMT